MNEKMSQKKAPQQTGVQNNGDWLVIQWNIMFIEQWPQTNVDISMQFHKFIKTYYAFIWIPQIQAFHRLFPMFTPIFYRSYNEL